jgi:phosphate-selective porin OprO/OprP
MAKRLAEVARSPTALLAWLAAMALAPAAFGQTIGDGLPPIVGPPLIGPPISGPPAVGPSILPAAAIETPLVEEQPSSDARLKSVESQLQKLLDADAKRKADAARKPTFQMGGQMQVDYLYIGQNSANRASVGEAQDTFDFRRARLTARGEVFDVFEYSTGYDFAQAGRPSFLDNWIAVRDLPVLGNVRVGHYFEPFSLERYASNRVGTFSERSLADTFAPSRNLGMMAHDTVGDDEMGTWAVGWFRSNSNNFGDDFSSVGGNAVTGRTTRLLYYDESDGRTFLHVGGAYTYRSEDRRQIEFQSFPEARAGTPGPVGIPPFVDTGAIAALSDQRWGAELAFVRGPFYMQAEYMAANVNQIGGPPLFFQGAYGFVSYFLTGENRTYNKKFGVMDRVIPYTNFFRVRTDDGIATGSGAWEVAARWSFIDLNSHNIQGGNLNDVTLTLNWHLSPFTRIRWEYIYAQLNRAPVGESFAQIAGIRFDMDF